MVENTTEPETGIEHLIGFVCETPIYSIKRATDDNIGHWFYEVYHADLMRLLIGFLANTRAR